MSMKTRISLSLLAVALLSTGGCISYERRTVEPVVTEPVVATERVVTVLPTGARVHVVNGTKYYYYNNYYYRTAPTGYYVTTVRPW